LQLAGFDSQLAGYYSENILTDDLTTFVSETLGIDPKDEELRQFNVVLKSVILSIYSSGGIAPSPEKQDAFFSYLGGLQSRLEPLAKNDPEVSFWIQVLKSARSYATMMWGMAASGSGEIDPALIELRDIQMGQNLLWLANEYYPNHKIIVWAATYHLARNLETITVADPELLTIYANGQVMGDIVHDELGDQVYVLGITAYSGTSGIFGMDMLELAPPSENSLEDLVNRTGLEFAFLDLHTLPAGGAWLQEELYSRVIGHSEMQADWTNILDGMLFIQEMAPSSPIP
jgi:erythromycin esterase